jgi:putative transposase
MRASRFSEEQIIHLSQQAERGASPISTLCREHSITETTIYRWRKKFGGMTVPDAQPLRELEQENARLKRLLALHRATLDYQPRPDRNVLLASQIHDLARRYPRYGYRRVWALLRRHGQQVNKKHVHRLWTRAELQVHKVQRKRRPARRAMVPVQAMHPGHVWTYDFLHEHCLNGTPLKVLTVMDEFTREGLALEVATSLPAQRVLAVLEQLVAMHGAPQFVRSDNGPEFIALGGQ